MYCFGRSIAQDIVERTTGIPIVPVKEVENEPWPTITAQIYRGTSSERVNGKIRIATYNCYEHRLENKDTLKHLIDHHDIILLQETRPRHHEKWRWLPNELHSIYVPDNFYNRKDPTDTGGNMILSRLPFEDSWSVTLPVASWDYHYCEKKQHKIRRNIVRVQTEGIIVGNTHLDAWCSPSSRRKQLAPHITSIDHRQPTILGGDFNLLYRFFGLEEPVFETLQKQQLQSTMGDARPKKLSHACHYIWHSRQFKKEKSTFLPLKGSDHYPLSATLHRE